MKQVTYFLQFKGSAAPKEGSEGVMEVTERATSESVRTSVLPDGVECKIEPLDGPEATFESTVTMSGDNKFDEKGSISFGSGKDRLRFSSLGPGFMEASPEPGITYGGVVFRVDGGDGVFDGASGHITSNFSLNEAGEVTDNQVGILYIK